MATAKLLIAIALLFFNIIQLSYTYWVPKDEKFWSLEIGDLSKEPPNTALNNFELDKLFKALSEKLRKEAVIEDRTIEYDSEEIPQSDTEPPYNFELDGILKALSEKLRKESIIEDKTIDYEDEEIPLSDLTEEPPNIALNDFELDEILKALSVKIREEADRKDRAKDYEDEEIPLKFNLDLESLSSSRSNSESSEENNILPLLLALESKLNEQKENQRKKKELEKRQKSKPYFRSIFDFQPDQGINDVFLKSVKPIKRTDEVELQKIQPPKEINVDLKNYSLFVTTSNTPDSIKYILIQTVPVVSGASDVNYIDQSPYLEQDPPDFKDYTLRVEADDENLGGAKVNDKKALVDGYRSLYKLSSKDDTGESKPKAIRIAIDSISPKDVELKNRRGFARPAKRDKTQPFAISMQDFNDAINILKNNGKDKRIMLG